MVILKQSLRMSIWVYHVMFTEKFIFQPSIFLRHPQRILNVVPGDYNNDGRLDLLVMSDDSTGENAMFVYFSDLVGGFGMFTRVCRL